MKNITCLSKQGSWLYLGSYQDAYSRKAVSWDVREMMPEDLVNKALCRADSPRECGQWG
ncbi:hypothetical protein HER32_05880 [Hymenobacter sp. BT18]|uniref:hypothetical protein n=1 Tax=Hymenobacter sp. BT18 TaxID=2835648 RepID=UPI00143ED32E|nr:hypothetical protein [Hymenobacter sp. BT18]QIX60727.1 hypothetical protein HER32_05880 [Hymenobacter sp. BT18]